MNEVFRVAKSGEWALGYDRLQWILLRARSKAGGRPAWDSVAFVSTDKVVLARCMREKGLDPGDAAELLAGLPATFGAWRGAVSQDGAAGLVGPRFDLSAAPRAAL